MKRLALLIVAVLCMAFASSAVANWNGTGNGSGYSKASSLSAGNAPTTSVSGRNVTVSWTAPGGATPVSGYTVKRYSAGGAVQNIRSNCTGTITTLSCTEQDVPSGSWTYTVTPRNANWQGAESPTSSTTNVGSPQLQLSGSTSLSTLPGTLNGTISNYVAGQTVTFRLDDANTGTTVAGTTNPTPTPSNGQASVSVTIPAGTANGSHTLYAIGSGGDAASAAFTVAVPTTITTTAWDIKDASGGAEAPFPDVSAYADGFTGPTGNFASTFSTSRYLQFDLNAPLETGATVSSSNFAFRFADAANNKTACFYFDVRRASTGAVLATHGNGTTPTGCVIGTTQQTFTTPLPEVASTAVANDLRVRVYVKESASAGIKVDQGTVSVTTGGSSYTLYEASSVEASSGTPTTYPWSIAAANDGAAYTSSLNWLSSFTSARYLKLSFPAYVPTGASIDSASFTHSYRSATTGQTCYYFEVYSGATLLGTHGSSSNPVSCNSGTTYVTDATSLPEVTTAAQANNLTVRVYVKNGGGLKSQDDLDSLTIGYVR